MGYPPLGISGVRIPTGLSAVRIPTIWGWEGVGSISETQPLLSKNFGDVAPLAPETSSSPPPPSQIPLHSPNRCFLDH